MLASLRRRSLRWYSEPIDGNCTRLGTAVETNAAAGAVVPCVMREMHTIWAQFSSKHKTLRRARLDAEAAALALVNADLYVASRLTRHVHLATLLSPARTRLPSQSLFSFCEGVCS